MLEGFFYWFIFAVLLYLAGMELDKHKNKVEEPKADYKKAEESLLRKALSSSYTERFHAMTQIDEIEYGTKICKNCP
ncbi:hypothetical protein [Pedobacter sp. UBA4863]|mgnify:CR=1 FL=1|uniref:hypothetical protein n=1 Tax=Pedobacter sp. UBA4863 TaxID=1947060 RepID=UPI0025F2692D|nr:hypothetical protein [Pedobacter sp. UBA4863]